MGYLCRINGRLELPSIRTTLKKQPETAVFLRLNGMKVERMLLAAEIPKARTMLLISAVGSLKTMA